MAITVLASRMRPFDATDMVVRVGITMAVGTGVSMTVAVGGKLVEVVGATTMVSILFVMGRVSARAD
jgi:hypothetical protein